MKLSDYVAEFLAKQNIEKAFGFTGGSVCHLFDSLDKNPKIKPIFMHHEQAAAFAAVSYARVSENLGACFVTTGPGGTNAITGLAAAWLDSIPCIFISGQARVEHTTKGKLVRQIGTQQLDIVPIVSHISKYAHMIEDPKSIKYHLQKAVYIAKSMRPGPVWIDLPLNLQWVDINPDELEEFNPAEEMPKLKMPDVQKCFDMLRHSKRPLILAGAGVKLAHARKEFRKAIDALKIPFITSWAAADIIETNEPLNIGRPGIAGQRGANLAIQNCDLVLAIGSHLCIPITGTDFKTFARDAKRIVVDIDKDELLEKTVRVDLSINANARQFLETLTSLGKTGTNISEWKNQCAKYKEYNKVPKSLENQKKFVNPYVMIDMVSDLTKNDDVIVVDGGGNTVYTSYQAAKIRPGQRMVLSTGLCAMGSGLPESVGAAFASKSRIICFIGDGSMQLNIQELQTIRHHNLPIKMFILNNGGYLSIRNTQDSFLGGNHIGSEPSGGMSLPDYMEVARSYGFKAVRLHNHNELKKELKSIMDNDDAIICEIMISPEQEVVPRAGFKTMHDGTFTPLPLEDMLPRLDREEFKSLMVVEPLPISLDD